MSPEESDHFAETTPENIIPTNMLDKWKPPWSWRAASAGSCVSSSILVKAEYNDRWGCRNRQVTLIMFMSRVLQHCRSFGLSRIRRQRIGAQNSVLVGSVNVLVQDRETGFAARGVLLAICCGSSGERRTHAVIG